jgi:hypothetical protein
MEADDYLSAVATIARECFFRETAVAGHLGRMRAAHPVQFNALDPQRLKPPATTNT